MAISSRSWVDGLIKLRFVLLCRGQVDQSMGLDTSSRSEQNERPRHSNDEGEEGEGSIDSTANATNFPTHLPHDPGTGWI